MFVNSFNAAIEGVNAIPTEWTLKTTLYPQARFSQLGLRCIEGLQVVQWANQLLAHRA